MAKHTQWRKARPWKDQEIYEIAMSQRRHDSYGRRLRVYSLDELAGMSAAELAKVKAAGSLPDMITMHGPLRFDTDGNQTPCPCEDCESAREAWRELTGRD